MAYQIYRNDDVSAWTDPLLFKRINDLFKQYNKIHSCGVLFYDLWENHELWHLLITEPNIEINWHGWRHEDYSVLPYEAIAEDIQKSLNYWKTKVTRGYGVDKVKPIKKCYPTWHQISPALERACKDNGLILDARNSGDVFCFHGWEAIENERLEKIEKALQQ